MSMIRPSWLRMLIGSASVDRKIRRKVSGASIPSTEGPSKSPARISPTARGWPTRRAKLPAMRAVTMMMATWTSVRNRTCSTPWTLCDGLDVIYAPELGDRRFFVQAAAQTDGRRLGLPGPSRPTLDVPDDPELFQHEQHEVGDVQLIPPVEPGVRVGRMRVMVVVPSLPQVEEGDERVVARGARPARRTLGRVRADRVGEVVRAERGVPAQHQGHDVVVENAGQSEQQRQRCGIGDPDADVVALDPEQMRTVQIRRDVPCDALVDLVPEEPPHVGAPEPVDRRVEVLLGVGGPVVMTVQRHPPEEPSLARETSDDREHQLEPGMCLVRSVAEVAMVSRPHADLEDEPHQQGPDQVRY